MTIVCEGKGPKLTFTLANDNHLDHDLRTRTLLQLWQDVVAVEAALGSAAHYRPESGPVWRRLRRRSLATLRRAVLAELSAAGLIRRAPKGAARGAARGTTEGSGKGGNSRRPS